MTHEELVLKVRKQEDEISRLSELAKRLYEVSDLPRLENERRILAEIEARAEVLAKDHDRLRIQAEQGNVRAQFMMGYIYYHAKGVAEDSVLGIEWWNKAAKNGHPEAQWELGNAYVTGQGVDRDEPTGYAWYSISADSGFTFAKRDKGRVGQKMQPGDIIRGQEIAKHLLLSFPQVSKV